MRISGTEPSSVILSQTNSLKRRQNDTKMTKQGKAKRSVVISPENYNSNEFQTWKRYCSQNASNQPKLIVELDSMCPRGPD